MITSLFSSQIPARTAHCNKMTNCSQSKKNQRTRRTRRRSLVIERSKKILTKKTRTMVMTMGHNLIAIDWASWETPTRVAAG